GVNARYSHSCLALFYLRAALARHLPQCPARIVQFTINDPYHEMLLRVAVEKPWAVFLSAAIWNSEIVAHLARDLRFYLPKSRIVIGGPQAGVLQRELSDFGCAVVIGAVEGIGNSLYQDLLSGHLAASYQAARLATTGAAFPFPYRDEDFAGELRHRHVYYESSRGCPHACGYCLSARERGVFHKDLPRVFQELTAILKHQPKELRFVDRTFNALPERALAIWRFLAAQRGNTRIHCEIAPEGFSDEMFAFLATQDPGGWQLEIGIQSTNAATLAAINRRMDIGAALATTKRLAALGSVFIHADLILGLPDETRESYLVGFAALFATGAHYIQMGLLKVLPGTPLAARAEAYGFVYSHRPPYGVLATRWLDGPALAELYWFGECVEKFHNNAFFPSLWRYLRATDEDAAAFFLGLTALFQRRGGFQRAATQEFLAEVLTAFIAPRPDAELLFDLLRYDWLRTGQRRLPEFLALPAEREDMAASHDRAYRLLPPQLPGFYAARERNVFCRRLVCLRLGRESLAFLGWNEQGLLCFPPEKERGLFPWQRVLLLPDADKA
ncbi:MAG TPA: Mg-protoporphyrin IX monomethyl ester oxidative cyclase, partial [Desulfobulbaceae bacterium]|nr:Mg-protoporphyrin IX monomethyl ester oxidative cyclase [Desulfobulbaceae bacterium]